MKIGIVIAIVRELKAFLDSSYQVETIIINNREVYKTKIGSNEVYAICSGYGMIDAASATQVLISSFNVDAIFNFGVTGALIKGLKVNDLFIVNKAVNYMYDVSPIDPVKKCQYEEFKDIYIPLDEGLIQKAKKVSSSLKDATVATGDKFVEKFEDKEELAALGCNICDMEIAAIARTCFKNKVPCLSIKCISDSLEGSGTDFNTNVITSAQKAFSMIDNLIKNL